MLRVALTGLLSSSRLTSGSTISAHRLLAQHLGSRHEPSHWINIPGLIKPEE